VQAPLFGIIVTPDGVERIQFYADRLAYRPGSLECYRAVEAVIQRLDRSVRRWAKNPRAFSPKLVRDVAATGEIRMAPHTDLPKEETPMR